MRNRLLAVLLLAAACAPAPETPAEAPGESTMAPDTAAVRAAVDGIGARWSEYAVAGDAAAIAATFTEDGTVAFFGFPTTTGRAGIEALMAGAYSVVDVTAAESRTGAVAAPAPGIATALGTYTETVDSSGVVITTWVRWAAAYRQDADGQWQHTYLISFPDSTKR